MSNAKHDENAVPTLIGVSSVDGVTPVNVWVDPTTHRLLVDVSGATLTLYTETPSGTINGVNAVFSTANTISSVFGLYMNGQYIHPADYSTSGTTITFVTAPDSSYSGLPFTIVYA